MLSFAAILVLSFFLGMRHASDPDHVVAVTTIVTRQRGIAKAALIGALWGLGHTFTIFVVGTMIILFQVTIPPRLGLAMEFAVAAMLILLGVLNLTGTLRRLQERWTSGIRPPESSLFPDEQAPAAPASSAIPLLQGFGWFNAVRPLIVGTVHGLAGSAAVALLVMTTIHDSWWAIAYLLLFGLGTVAGMMLITAMMAMPLVLAAKKFSSWNHGLATASGLLSLGFGLFLSYQIGVVDGFFAAHPQWNPH